MEKYRFSCCLGGLLAAALSGTAFSQTRDLGAGGELLDGVAAIVDEGVVLKSELEKQVAALKDDGESGSGEGKAKLWNPVTISIAVVIALLLTAVMVGVFVIQRRDSIYDDQHELDEDEGKAEGD